MWDAVVIGGGIYGATIAGYLVEKRGFVRVLLLEREPVVMRRASFNNQGRIHAGYHYPRSWNTAVRSRLSVARFLRDHPSAVRTAGTVAYAVARSNSRTHPRQFERFCAAIGAPLHKPPPAVAALFDRERVEAVYCVEESGMDVAALAESVTAVLQRRGVDVRLSTEVREVARGAVAGVRVAAIGTEGLESIDARYVFNCSYSGLRSVTGAAAEAPVKLRHELAELAIVTLPPELREVAITVVDGPFFSLLPHVVAGQHTLSHVRHTPHLSWDDQPDVNPYSRLVAYAKVSRVDRMLRASQPFVPSLKQARYVDSIFEVKTVLAQNEVDDGRPILFERSAEVLGVYSILGGKIDNVYDVLDRLDAEPFPLRGAA